MKKHIQQFFHLAELGTTVRQEVVAGVTTFVTMAYILIVNPKILEAAGMPFGPSMVATIVSASFGTLLMGVYARRPPSAPCEMPLDRRSARMVRPTTASIGPARLLPTSMLRSVARVACVLHVAALKHRRIGRNPHHAALVAADPETSDVPVERAEKNAQACLRCLRIAGMAVLSKNAWIMAVSGRLRFRRSAQRWGARY